MEKHQKNLQSMCRLGGGKLHKGYDGRSSTEYLVSSHVVEIMRCYDLDVRADDPSIHPTHFCGICKASMSRFVCTTSSVTSESDISTEEFETPAGCGPLMSWSSHKRTQCLTCEKAEKNSKGGRPAGAKKRKRNARSARSKKKK